MLRSDELEVIPYAGPPCTFDQRRRVDLGQLATPPFELVEVTFRLGRSSLGRLVPQPVHGRRAHQELQVTQQVRVYEGHLGRLAVRGVDPAVGRRDTQVELLVPGTPEADGVTYAAKLHRLQGGGDEQHIGVVRHADLAEAHPGGLRQAEALQMLQRERADLRLAPEPDEIGMCDGQRVPPTLGKSLSNSSVRARFAASRDAWSP